MNNTIKPPYQAEKFDFITASYEQQKEIVEYWKVWGKPSSTPVHIGRILLAVKEKAPIVLGILPSDLKEACSKFYWEYIREQQGIPDYSKAVIDFDRVNGILIIDIEHDVYHAELTPEQYKRYVICNGNEGMDWKIKEGEIELINTPYEQQWLQAILYDTIVKAKKLEL